MKNHPLFDECLKGAQRVIKAEGDVKFEEMMHRKYPRETPKDIVRCYKVLLKAELMALSLALDKWMAQGAPIEEKDNGNK